MAATDIAVVGYAQTPSSRRARESEVQLLVPIVTEALQRAGLDRPFAFALVTPDGADSAMVHAVDAGSIDRMSTGMRVRPRWRAEPHNMIDDIACWEPT